MRYVQQISEELDLFDRMVIYRHADTEQESVTARIWSASTDRKFDNYPIRRYRIPRVCNVAEVVWVRRMLLHCGDVDQCVFAIVWMEGNGAKSAVGQVVIVEVAAVAAEDSLNIEKERGRTRLLDDVDPGEGADCEVGGAGDIFDADDGSR